MVKSLKIIDDRNLVALNSSSIRARRKQHIKPELFPADSGKTYTVNFSYDHDFDGGKDVRMCVILELGVNMAWLDVSKAEFDVIPDVEMSELEWEASVCCGVPPWTP